MGIEPRLRTKAASAAFRRKCMAIRFGFTSLRYRLPPPPVEDRSSCRKGRLDLKLESKRKGPAQGRPFTFRVQIASIAGDEWRRPVEAVVDAEARQMVLVLVVDRE